MGLMSGPMLSRRSALLGLAAAFTLGRTSIALGAAPGQKRFVVVLLRGALDGLSAVQPYGDAACAGLRGDLALAQPGQPDGLLDLGGFYGLHPKLANLHDCYKSGDALILHAVAGHYRSRSHFEAQDFLEAGVDQRISSGWLNRAVAAMPAVRGQEIALSMGLSAPLILRGPAQVEAWAPDKFGTPHQDLLARLMTVSAHDSLLGPALAEGLKAQEMPAAPGGAMGPDGKPVGAEVTLAGAAGRLLAANPGPRVAVLELGGWDTHGAQKKRLEPRLEALDRSLAALKAGLGDAWKDTAVLVVTEFGRTARMNGTAGTDHGTGGVAFLVGGAVAGGKVRADWPGLGSGRLLEDRDLMPTADVRSIAKGVLSAHLGLGAAGLDAAFPGSGDAPAMSGLVRV